MSAQPEREDVIDEIWDGGACRPETETETAERGRGE